MFGVFKVLDVRAIYTQYVTHAVSNAPLVRVILLSPAERVIQEAVQYVAEAAVLSHFIQKSHVGVHVIEATFIVSVHGVHETLGTKDHA